MLCERRQIVFAVPTQVIRQGAPDCSLSVHATSLRYLKRPPRRRNIKYTSLLPPFFPLTLCPGQRWRPSSLFAAHTFVSTVALHPRASQSLYGAPCCCTTLSSIVIILISIVYNLNSLSHSLSLPPLFFQRERVGGRGGG